MSDRGRGRGRGRGGRGRGGRGRGGRGRSRGRGAASQIRKPVEEDWNKVFEDEREMATDLDIEDNPRDYFMGNVTFDEHYKAQCKDKDMYAASIAVMLRSGYELPASKFLMCMGA